MKRLIVVSVLLILVGLLLLLPSNPLVSILTGGPGSPGPSSGASPDPTMTMESLVGFGLIGLGLLLEIFSLFTDVGTPGARAEIAEVKRS